MDAGSIRVQRRRATLLCGSAAWFLACPEQVRPGVTDSQVGDSGPGVWQKHNRPSLNGSVGRSVSQKWAQQDSNL